MLPALSLLPALVSLAHSDTWHGTLDYAPYAAHVPLNITTDTTAQTAMAAWVWDKDAGGHLCRPNTETGLKIVSKGSSISFVGNDHDPSFYTLTGTLAGDTITGTIQDHNHKEGTFTVTKNGAPAKTTCVPKPLPPGPPPPSPPHPTTHALLWPLPTRYTNGSATLTVVPSASSQGFFKGPKSALLDAAFARYSDLTFPHKASGVTIKGSGRGASVAALTVSVDSTAEDFPQLETNESYTLVVSSAGEAKLHAPTVFGAMRGLETFSQLVVFDFNTQTYTVPFAPWAIVDRPRFPHRGLMIDSARHFETLSTVKKVINSLSYAKLNVLHWHMTDTQSFPWEVTGHNMWAGSYSDQERFTQLDVRDIVEYARLRGVRVMVEFDMPGHAGSWCKGRPDLCPSASCTQPLNVANPATFEFIEELLHQCTGGRASAPGNPSPGVFKDNFIHLGGDEVNTACWASTPSIAAWLKNRSMTPDDGYAYFVKKTAAIATAQGHRPVQWSEVYDHFKNTLPKQVIIHIWKKVTNVTEPLAGGYNAIVNVGYDSLSWYLDNLGTDWKHVYENEPCYGVPDHLCPMVLGGHGEMWGETVDSSDIEQTVWPRLAAIAERLWSPRELTDTSDAQDRITAFRCLLNRRGVAAAPVRNANARSAPPGPGSCYQQ